MNLFIKSIAIFICLSFLVHAQNERSIWLDELDLATMTSGWDEPKKNLSVEGQEKIKLKGTVYEHGVGVHASSEYSINLKKNALLFTCIAGVDDHATYFGTTGGTANFKVFLDSRLVFESGKMKAMEVPKNISIDLAGAQVLKLVLEDAGDGTHGDHCDWANGKITYKATGEAPAALYSIVPVKPFILTPTESSKPSINGPEIYGARPGSPFLYRVPVSGAKPVKVTISGLPQGLTFDADKRIITGSVKTAGTYITTIIAANDQGTDQKAFEIVIGEKLSLTPPMGWNSWNAFGLKVNGDIVKEVATVFEKSGLVEYGFNFVNIDDGWEADQRDANGKIVTNAKFPDMKGLADYIHSKGLKFGIYSSPGPKTCGNFLGSYNYEKSDAETYAAWGVDYIKYDWCSYGDVVKGRSLPELQKPYLVMKDALRAQPRDIVYSLCQYGMGNVSSWGASVGGQCWRTTGDIVDTWGSLNSIALAQSGLEKYAAPGQWNDPDMLILGKVGWGNPLRTTRLNACEQYTHMTLWCMLSAPLLLGCDIESMDEYTLSLLKNKEVLAINQDKLGKQAGVVKQSGDVRVWQKALSGNRVALAVVNHGYDAQDFTVKLSDLGISSSTQIRDVWRQTNQKDNKTITLKLAPHASEMFVVSLK